MNVHVEASGQPLGFSLLFRDRKAWLSLDEHTLAPGATLRDYLAEIPGVAFPLQAPLSAASFSHRRCRAAELTLELSSDGLRSFVRERLLDQRLCGLEVREVDLALDAPPRAITLVLFAVDASGRGAHLIVVLDPRVDGRRIAVRPHRTWVMATSPVEPRRLWSELGRQLGLKANGEALLLDPTRFFVAPAFVRAGWKVPDLRGLALAELQHGTSGMRVRFRDDASPAAVAEPDGRYAQVDDLIAQGRRRPVDPSTLERLIEALEGFELAQTAARAWAIDRLRHAQGEDAATACLAHLDRWLAGDPDDRHAKRWRVELLARLGRYDALARLTSEARDRASSMAERAHLDLALARLHADKLADPDRGRSFLRRWTQVDGELAYLRPQVRLAMAHTEVGQPFRARTLLDEALASVEDPDLRMAEQVSLAAAMFQNGEGECASDLLRAASAEPCTDDETLTRATDLALRLHDASTATGLLRRRLDGSDDPDLLRVLAMQSDAADEPQARDEVRRALEHHPSDPALLSIAACRARDAGDRTEALEWLDALEQAQPDHRLRHRAERVALLLDDGQAATAWSLAEPAWPDVSAPARARLVDLALRSASPDEVLPWLTRLDALDPAIAAEALEARWRQHGLDASSPHLVDLLETLERPTQALAVAQQLAEAGRDAAEQAHWWSRAAALSPEGHRATLLARSAEALPGDRDLHERWLDAAQREGDTAHASALLERIADDDAQSTVRRVDALDALIAQRRGAKDAIEAARDDPGLLALHRKRLELRPDDPTSLVALGDAAASDDDLDTAEAHWRAAVDLLPPGDPQALPRAVALAERALSRGDPGEAQERLRAFDRDPLDPRVASVLARALATLGETRELERALGRTDDPLKIRTTVADTLGDAGRWDEAIAVLEPLAGLVEPQSSAQLDLAQRWLALAQATGNAAQEAKARAQLRRARGDDLSPADACSEAMLLAERLGDVPGGLDLLDLALARHPADELLLSSFKALCLLADEPERYVAALQQALDAEPSRGDGWLQELAATAVEVEDAPLAWGALERMSVPTQNTPEMLDVRDWAVRQLGRQVQERETIATRLREHPSDDVALERLIRLEGSPANAADVMLTLAAGLPAERATPLVERATDLALRDREAPLLVRALRHAAAIDLPLVKTWARAFELVLQADDEVGAADLLELAAGRASEPELMASVPLQLERALATLPGQHLLRRLWAETEGHDDRVASALARIERLSDEHELEALARTELMLGMTDQIGDRPRRAEILADLGQRLLTLAGDDTRDDALSMLIDGMVERGHIPQALRLLEARVERTEAPSDKVALHKRLIFIHTDVLGDPDAAARHLEAALEFAPKDPDLLLPLLDDCFTRKDLGRAVALTERVLEHVPMGEMAFLSLAHRAADAALAQGDLGSAANLLDRAATRAPGDRKTSDRRAELDAMQGDPEHRVRLLATIAARQTGRARIEALEERARLLVDPLGRPELAIIDLEAILNEDANNDDVKGLLRELYAQGGRWTDVVGLLEREFPRRHGIERARLLHEAASVYRDHLLDVTRAEQALRLALDHLGESLDEHARELAETMRTTLVDNLRTQGRYVDLAIYLERALAPEIEGRVDAHAIHEQRATLLVELARIYRGPLDDETKAGRIYERLEQVGLLPDEGLATLAHTYRRAGRHEDLVRILTVRARALAEAGELRRKAAVDERIAELLEGPLGRPHEAATHYLDAYLVDPKLNASAGARARVLLSGVDAVVNVKRQLLSRLEGLAEEHRPALLTLLGDILSPQDDHEAEAETRYRQALELDSNYGLAHESLGRLLARQGRLQDAAQPLIQAATHPDIPPARAAEDAAIAARALLELDRPEDAELVLKQALQRAPDSQRALLELTRLYERLGRTTEQAIVLENLSQLPLSSMLGAEVAYRRAMLLMPAAYEDPYCPEAERARAYLLEAVSADAKHVAARQTLLDLAHSRLEWSVVAHMHYLAIRELPPGPPRALVHLDLAQTYLDHLDDVESAMRNIESAIQQAPEDRIVASRTGSLAGRLPDARKVAERFERLASAPGDLSDPARAHLWLLAADLRMTADDPAAAEANSQAVLDLDVPDDATAAARRNLDLLADDEARDLRQQKSGLLKLLDTEENELERLHILGRLREIGQALGDGGLIEWASREQFDLAAKGDHSDEDLEAASAALTEVYAERGSYEEIIGLYEHLAARVHAPQGKAEALVEAARFSWNGQRNAERGIRYLRDALELDPDSLPALSMLGELTRQSEDRNEQEAVYEQLLRLDPRRRPLALELELAKLAFALGRTGDTLALLRPLTVQTHDAEMRFAALRQLDGVLSSTGVPGDRLPVLRRYLGEAHARNADEVPDIAMELARVELSLGNVEQAAQTVRAGLEFDPDHRGLMLVDVELLERREHWDALARALERLAMRTPDHEAQARYLVEASRVQLDRQANHGDVKSRRRAVAEARRLLVRACESAPRSPLPRSELIPLSFSEGRWDEVLELAIELREYGDEDDPALILAALTQAFRHGQRSLARDLGHAFDAATLKRSLYPGLRQLLGEVASRGPLPRLDPVLGAAATLHGGGVRLLQGLRAWAAGRPVLPGIALGLARLAEANGEGVPARHLYQLAAFTAPEGPTKGLVARLPIPGPPADLDPSASGPLEALSMLRRLLVELRDPLRGTVPEPQDEEVTASSRLALADTIIDPWRAALGLPLPVAWVAERLPGGVAAENRATPTIAIGPGVAANSVPELRFRLAHATAGIAMGLVILETRPGAHSYALVELLDAMVRLANPGHIPTGRSAQVLADILTQRAAPYLRLTAGERENLMDELSHWLTQPGGLERLGTDLQRARLLLATHLSGQLDGALEFIARDHDLVDEGHPDAAQTLQLDDARWLLRSLAL